MERIAERVDAGVVYYNEGHPDYLGVKGDERSLLDDPAEEMVRMVVLARR